MERRIQLVATGRRVEPDGRTLAAAEAPGTLLAVNTTSFKFFDGGEGFLNPVGGEGTQDKIRNVLVLMTPRRVRRKRKTDFVAMIPEGEPRVAASG